jgi:hypothetical protein
MSDGMPRFQLSQLMKNRPAEPIMMKNRSIWLISSSRQVWSSFGPSTRLWQWALSAATTGGGNGTRAEALYCLPDCTDNSAGLHFPRKIVPVSHFNGFCSSQWMNFCNRAYGRGSRPIPARGRILDYTDVLPRVKCLVVFIRFYKLTFKY